MAATNRPEVLDPALTRPDRFDRQDVVDRPDLKGREAILKVHTRGVGLDPAVDLCTIASRTPGFTGADLANVVNEAALLAARREKPAVGIMDLEEAIDRVIVGPERKSRVIAEQGNSYVIFALVMVNMMRVHQRRVPSGEEGPVAGRGGAGRTGVPAQPDRRDASLGRARLRGSLARG
jgi:ATP-dependent Zn protease